MDNTLVEAFAILVIASHNSLRLIFHFSVPLCCWLPSLSGTASEPFHPHLFLRSRSSSKRTRKKKLFTILSHLSEWEAIARTVGKVPEARQVHRLLESVRVRYHSSYEEAVDYLLVRQTKRGQGKKVCCVVPLSQLVNAGSSLVSLRGTLSKREEEVQEPTDVAQVRETHGQLGAGFRTSQPELFKTGRGANEQAANRNIEFASPGGLARHSTGGHSPIGRETGSHSEPG